MMTQVQEAGNEKVACNYLLWIFISTPETAVNCTSLTVNWINVLATILLPSSGQMRQLH